MKKISLLVFAAITAISCEQDKIAYVDNTKLIKEYQEKIDLENEYKIKYENFQKKYDSVSSEFQKEAQAFESSAKSLGQAKAQEQYNALMQKRQQMAQSLQQQEQMLQQESSQEVDSLVKKVRGFIKDYGKNNGYTFILAENEGGNVFYGEDSKDITDEVLTELNNTYKAKK
ncbi:OmpH/Skp family outer membrane protein [Robertkochia flava]|uniref:OmpH family outer membrane protein n=1 Tax=Robertkochia flava TaxID=3447986 RepID=UPI001CCFB888|nr:OmpH family outer membrane protein [Robertkochia marina]